MRSPGVAAEAAEAEDFTEAACALAASTAEAATARQAVFERAIRSRDVPLPAGPATQAARSQDDR
jgi:hypothetical protein